MASSSRATSLVFVVVALLALWACAAVAKIHHHELAELDIMLASPAYSEDLKAKIRERVAAGDLHRQYESIGQQAASMSLTEEKRATLPAEVDHNEKRHHGARQVSHVILRRDGERAVRHMVKALGARNPNSAVILDYAMVAAREPSLEEESINNLLSSWLAIWRMADDAEAFFNTVTGLRHMAMNLSIAAADVFGDFESITWEPMFKEKVKCSLDFTQPDRDHDVGVAYNFPDWCVKSMDTAYLITNTTQDLQTQLFEKFEDVILNNDYNQIAIQCVTPDPVAPASLKPKWWCYLYFVELTDVISSANCACSVLSCCPVGLGI